jgi:hypothetical protein
MSATNGAPDAPRPRGQKAADQATEQNSVRVSVPVIGIVTLPPAENLAFLGGIVLLTVLEVMEWPVAVALAAGHALATRTHNKIVQDFGRALEEA